MKLIKLQDKFILVSDEEIKEGDKHYNLALNIIETTTKYNNGLLQQKIISEKPDFSLLSKEDCKKIGWVDVDAIIKKAFYKENGDFKRSTIGADDWIEGLKFGVKTVQSLNDKMFSLKNMREAIAEAWNSCEDNEDGETFTQCFNRIIQSLQKTEWDVEVEMELNIDKAQLYMPNTSYQAKITNNSIKVLKIL